MEYSFRTLNALDIAPMCSIISKIGMENIAKCMDGEKLLSMIHKKREDGVKGDGLTEIAAITFAFDAAGIIAANLPRCEKDVFTLLANVSGLSYDQISTLDLVTFTEMVVAFLKKEEFKGFIGVVSKLLK